MKVTQEYFDKSIGNILEKLGDIKTGMASKDCLKFQLDAQTKELKDHTRQAFESHRVWMDEWFKKLS